MVTYYELDRDSKITEAEKCEIAEAKKRPIVYDEDSPEMDDEMEQAFIAARMKKPLKEKPITVIVSTDTAEQALKMYGDDYQLVLGRLLDKAILGQIVQ